IGILGPLTARRSAAPLALGSARQRAVLGLLALHAGTVAHRETIIDTLWGERPPPSALAEVQSYVSRLRRILGDGSADLITTEGGSCYRLNAGPRQLDVVRFGELTDRAREAVKSEPAKACDGYEQALRLWRGGVLADIDLLRGHPAAVEMTRRRSDAVLGYADAAGRAGDHARAMSYVRELCAADPLNEHAHARLMIAVAATGQQAAALEIFVRLRRRLDEELGISPSPPLTEAHAQVLRQQFLAAYGALLDALPLVRGDRSGWELPVPARPDRRVVSPVVIPQVQTGERAGQILGIGGELLLPRLLGPRARVSACAQAVLGQPAPDAGALGAGLPALESGIVLQPVQARLVGVGEILVDVAGGRDVRAVRARHSGLVVVRGSDHGDLDHAAVGRLGARGADLVNLRLIFVDELLSRAERRIVCLRLCVEDDEYRRRPVRLDARHECVHVGVRRFVADHAQDGREALAEIGAVCPRGRQRAGVVLPGGLYRPDFLVHLLPARQAVDADSADPGGTALRDGRQRHAEQRRRGDDDRAEDFGHAFRRHAPIVSGGTGDRICTGNAAAVLATAGI